MFYAPWMAHNPYLKNGQGELAPNGIGLRRGPEANRAEGPCGWSGAPQRRVTPSPPDTQ